MFASTIDRGCRTCIRVVSASGLRNGSFVDIPQPPPSPPSPAAAVKEDVHKEWFATDNCCCCSVDWCWCHCSWCYCSPVHGTIYAAAGTDAAVSFCRLGDTSTMLFHAATHPARNIYTYRLPLCTLTRHWLCDEYRGYGLSDWNVPCPLDINKVIKI